MSDKYDERDAAWDRAIAATEVLEGELVPAVIPTTTLFGTDNPNEVLEHAQEHAKVLMRVVKEQNLAVRIGQAEHLRVEAWTMLGSQLGVFAVADGEPEVVTVDGVTGFRVAVKAVTRNGDIVGRAVGYCMRDEPTWAKRPLHAVAAMAETRATSRALRKPLGFIVQLAGYNPTAAEEMPDRPSQAATKAQVASRKKISDAQRKRLFAIATEHNVPDDRVKAIVLQTGGVESTKDLTVERYDLVVEMLEKQDGPPFA
jgi:hypothetical protein